MTPDRRVPNEIFGTVKERVGIQSTPESRAMSPDINESIINQNQPLTPPPRNPRGGEPIRPTPEISTPQRDPDPFPRETEKFNYDLVRGYTMPGPAPEMTRYDVPNVRNPFPQGEEFYYDPFRGYTKLSEKNRYDVPDEVLNSSLANFIDPNIRPQMRYKNGGRVQSSTKNLGERMQSYTNKSGGINLGSGRVSTASKNSKTPKW
jgi:hypothetical protein